MQQRLGDGQPLFHPFGELADALVLPLGHLDHLEHLVRTSPDVRHGHAPELPQILQRLDGREVRIELRRLDHCADVGQRHLRVRHYIDPVQRRLSRRRDQHVRQHLDGGGLARPVRSEETKESLVRDLERQRVHCPEPSMVIFYQVLNLYGKFHGSSVEVLSGSFSI